MNAIPGPLASCPFCEEGVAPVVFLRHEDLEWVRCPRCEGGWLEPYVGELERDAEDFAAPYRQYVAIKHLFDAVAEEKARWLLRHWTRDRIIVEIGPGVGSVAEIVRRLEPEAALLLVEPRASFAGFLRAAGFEVHSGDPTEATAAALAAVRSRGQRLLLFLDNVLEHVPFPARLLADIHARSLEGSQALVEVPNEQGLRWRAGLQDFLRGEPKPPTFPGHINLFTRPVLRRLCRRITGQDAVIYVNPMRRPAQVAYLTQVVPVNRKIRFALGLLNVLPIDRLFGVGYWLRAEIPIGGIAARRG
jgi:Zn-finger nucleic acid-binding protein